MGSYPTLQELSGRTIRDAPELFAGAPWFASNGVYERRLWEIYLDADRVFPGGIPERAVTSFECRQLIAVPRFSLTVPRRIWVQGRWSQWRQRVWDAGVAFVQSVPDKMDIMTGPPVVEGYRFYFLRARNPEEVPYVHALAMCRGLVHSWTEMGVTADVHAVSILWRSLRLPTDYETAKKAADPFWSDTV